MSHGTGPLLRHKIRVGYEDQPPSSGCPHQTLLRRTACDRERKRRTKLLRSIECTRERIVRLILCLRKRHPIVVRVRGRQPTAPPMSWRALAISSCTRWPYCSLFAMARNSYWRWRRTTRSPPERARPTSRSRTPRRRMSPVHTVFNPAKSAGRSNDTGSRARGRSRSSPDLPSPRWSLARARSFVPGRLARPCLLGRGFVRGRYRSIADHAGRHHARNGTRSLACDRTERCGIALQVAPTGPMATRLAVRGGACGRP